MNKKLLLVSVCVSLYSFGSDSNGSISPVGSDRSTSSGDSDFLHKQYSLDSGRLVGQDSVVKQDKTTQVATTFRHAASQTDFESPKANQTVSVAQCQTSQPVFEKALRICDLPAYKERRKLMKKASLETRSSGQNGLLAASGGIVSMFTAATLAYNGYVNEAMSMVTVGSTFLGISGKCFNDHQMGYRKLEEDGDKK